MRYFPGVKKIKLNKMEKKLLYIVGLISPIVGKFTVIPFKTCSMHKELTKNSGLVKYILSDVKMSKKEAKY